MPEWLHIVVRSFLYIFVLIILTKVLGKKQISQISFFEYVSGITIGSIAGEVIMGLEDHYFYGVIAISIFGAVTYVVDIVSLKSKKFRDLIEGKGSILIKDGKVMEDNLKKEKYSVDELSSFLRQKDVFNLADVEFAVLEPTGDLSVLLKKENRPLTPKDIHLQVDQEKEPQTIIMDGQILNDAMAAAGKTRKWLDIELENLNVTVENVFLAQVDSFGKLTVDIYDDKIQIPSAKPRALLMAMVKKCQADLELFAMETENEKAKQLFNKNANKLNEAITKLKPYLNE